MKCPNCTELSLALAERKGIEIDRFSNFRGGS